MVVTCPLASSLILKRIAHWLDYNHLYGGDDAPLVYQIDMIGQHKKLGFNSIIQGHCCLELIRGDQFITLMEARDQIEKMARAFGRFQTHALSPFRKKTAPRSQTCSPAHHEKDLSVSPNRGRQLSRHHFQRVHCDPATHREPQPPDDSLLDTPPLCAPHILRPESLSSTDTLFVDKFNMGPTASIGQNQCFFKYHQTILLSSKPSSSFMFLFRNKFLS